MAAGLTFDQLREVVGAARSRFVKDFRETQLRRDYVLKRLAFERYAQTEEPDDKVEWTIRRKAATGSVQSLQPYKQLNYMRDEYDTRMSVRLRSHSSHTNMVFDRIATAVNRTANKLWDDYKMKGSAAAEAHAEFLETTFVNPPYNENDQDNGFLSLLAWFARSMTSGGVFTDQSDAVKLNGVYRRFNDGTVSSSIGGLDASLAANSRLRTRVGTHKQVLDDTLLNVIDSAIIDLNVKYLSELKGESTTGDMIILWDDAFSQDYRRLMAKLGGPRGDDYFPMVGQSVSGCKQVAVPSLTGHVLRPIFIWRPSVLHVVKAKGLWGVPGEQQLTHNSVAYPIDYTWQIRCTQPDMAGALIHGSFTTGATNT